MKIIAALFASLLLPSAALAADLQARPTLGMAPAALSWSGFYFGPSFGFGWGSARGDLGYNDPAFPGVGASDVFASPGQSFSTDGLIAGGQAGVNWQVSRLVFGLEVDASWSGVEGKTTAVTIAGDPAWHVRTDLDWFGTVRGRLGYLVSDTVLVYGTGGIAFGRSSGSISVTYDAPPPTTEIARGEASATHWGWAAGAGIEYMLMRSVSLKVEYLYVDLGKKTHAFSGTQDNAPIAYNTDSFSPDLRVHVLRGGVNFRF